ncbi:LPS export ABC transporter periplasmic protein LptC [bacterium]|nr:LPS export ABC transporter periplasmic protein LptC [bacterium]
MNKKRFVKIFLVALVVLVAWGFLWSWFITRKVRTNSKTEAFKNQQVTVKNIVVTETQEDKKYWEFYAKSGEYNSGTNNVILHDIIGNFYNKQEEVELSFKSKKGAYNETTKRVELNGDNLFVGKDGTQMYADNLVWQGQDTDIVAEGNIQLVKDNEFVIKAQKAVFNTSLTHFKIEGKTKSMLYGDENIKKQYTQL